MLREAAAHNTESAFGMTNAVASSLTKKPQDLKALRRSLISRGFDTVKVEQAIQNYIGSGILAIEGDGDVRLQVDPNSLL
jgi:hypothetical protein